MPLSRPFVVATEGPTIDGRNISRQWIEQMAKNYSPAVYTAVANLEHYLSSLPDGIFKAYGKVVSLSTQEATILGEKKLQLLAVVDASDEIVAMQKKGQKAFASMEVINNFIGKGVAYLSGLAFTDKPASIGTESMKFSACGTEGERFSFADEVAIEFEEEKKPGLGEGLFAKVKELLGQGKKESGEQFADQAKAIEAIAFSQKEALEAIEKLNGSLQKFTTGLDEIKTINEAQATFAKDFAALKEKLGSTDGDIKHRPAATGADGQDKTDC